MHMRTRNNLSRFCVYAIKKSRKLHEISKNGGTDQLTERKRWTNAKKLLAEAQRSGRRMPIIFAAAENTENLIYYAEITKITLRHDATTTYSFTRLTPIDGRIPKTQLRKSTGKRIHSNFIKSYAICHTPAFLKKLVEADLSGQEREDAEIKDRTDIGPTEKQRLIQARCKQGVFRTNVSHYETVCRVTGISIPEHLIASHIKPWRESTKKERINGHNGLLLALHIDHSFDGGWISFEDDGSLLISQSLNQDVLTAWGISDQIIRRLFKPEQSAFLKYHRKHVFKK